VEGRRVGQHVLARVHTRAKAQVADARNGRVRGY
jgi:hypothetical protein